MPCYDSRNEPGYVRKEALEEFTHNSPVAEMLCAVLTTLEQEGEAFPHHPGLKQWWSDHKSRDAAKK